MLKSYKSEYVKKKGLFNSEKNDIYIFFYADKITGKALRVSENSDYSSQ